MLPKKYFSKYKKPLAPLLDLVEMQTDSYKKFLTDELPQLFKEISPINDYTEKEFSLVFSDLMTGELKCDEYRAKINNLSYEAPIKVWATLSSKKTGALKKEEIFLADLPMMTTRGTFIVNGVERVAVSQISRSFGLYFTANTIKDKKLFGAKIIPLRGAWIEIETDSDGALSCRLDRKRKLPV